MHLKIVENNLDSSYSIPVKPKETIYFSNGKSYTLLGQSEKIYTSTQRIWRGLRAITKTVITFGIGLISQKTQKDWSVFFVGRKIVQIYGPSFLATKILADRGSRDAQYELGCLYEDGKIEGSEEELKIQAFKYYKLAAIQGHTGAQFSVGWSYDNGLGVKKSLVKAFKYYQLAANRGNVYGQHNLACCYYKGEGTEKNYEKAFHYHTLAANQGDDDAQYGLGKMYEKGLGVDQSIDKARHYYQLAANQNHFKAIKKLEDLNTEIEKIDNE